MIGRLTRGAATPNAAGTNTRRTDGLRGPTGAHTRTQYTLYGSRRSGPTYKVALLLNLAHKPFDYVEVSLATGEHRQPQFLAKNRFGQVPCLRDANLYLCQSASILEHIAETTRRYNGRTSGEIARVREWMFWDFDKLAGPVYRLRGRALGVRQFGEEVAAWFTAEAKAALEILDATLGPSEWLASRRPTVADIDIYGVVRYAPEAGLDLSGYRHLGAWMQRIEGLAGFRHPDDALPKEDSHR